MQRERRYSCDLFTVASETLFSQSALLCRRLYPDMAFFQRPTEYPCQLILDPQNDYETLRRRVEQTTLKAQTVNRNRSGVTNVSLAAAASTSALRDKHSEKLRQSKLLWFSQRQCGGIYIVSEKLRPFQTVRRNCRQILNVVPNMMCRYN